MKKDLYNPLANLEKPIKTEASEIPLANAQNYQDVVCGGINTMQIPAHFDPTTRTCIPKLKK